ncbi:hypothetical protein JGH11_04895 [Dysgonomonas sp. Marseille-P4677]|uniref:hypothetical protein n=1 Tax=Dysgonomonas sp. Marseille-P4677 TaxID=2364790 RepID=UPI001914C82E|nr:hypothetical protein [Dysgonomonas sp. Marseille-P4677]MBK5720203.1 hypothetical protein [Dysgonomonas sp. Marseille-P4677]
MVAELVIAACLAGIVFLLLSEYKIDIRKKTDLSKNDEAIPKKKEKKVARVGRSIPDTRHMMTQNDSSLKANDIAEKENNFEPSLNESEPDPKDLVIDADPTETVIDEEEEIAAYTKEEVYTAGGMDYDVMMKTVDVINSKTASKEEEQKAGGVLHKNRNTELVSKMSSTKGALAARISSLIDLRIQQHTAEQIEGVDSGVASRSNEYDGFDASEFF